MYTRLDDERLANKVNELRQSNPNITQKEICNILVTNWHRLKSLEEYGYFQLERRFAHDAKSER